MDTDGWLEKSGTLAFGSVLENLRDQVVELVRSLGMVARAKDPKSKYYRNAEGEKVYGKPFHVCSFTWNGRNRVFLLDRKREKLITAQHRYRVRWIEAIEYIGNAPCMCVEVEGSLYLADNYTLTHNSALVAWITLWAFCTLRGTRGVVTAGTENQLRTKTWVELNKWHRLFVGSHLFEVTATSLFSNDPKWKKEWRIDTNPQTLSLIHI